MEKKNTKKLEEILMKTHTTDFRTFLDSNSDSMRQENNPFGVFVKKKIKEIGLSQQKLFLKADIPEGYGYKLLSGEKRTKQRDIILRICYAGGLNISDTQEALRLYEMPELYVKIPRDALIMICFNKRPGSILEVNELLRSNGFEALKTSGIKE